MHVLNNLENAEREVETKNLKATWTCSLSLFFMHIWMLVIVFHVSIWFWTCGKAIFLRQCVEAVSPVGAGVETREEHEGWSAFKSGSPGPGLQSFHGAAGLRWAWRQDCCPSSQSPLHPHAELKAVFFWQETRAGLSFFLGFSEQHG